MFPGTITWYPGSLPLSLLLCLSLLSTCSAYLKQPNLHSPRSTLCHDLPAWVIPHTPISISFTETQSSCISLFSYSSLTAVPALQIKVSVIPASRSFLRLLSSASTCKFLQLLFMVHQQGTISIFQLATCSL